MKLQGRRPFGLAGWLYWTVGIVGLLIVGNIPYIGPVLVLAGLIFIIVCWVRAGKLPEPTRMESINISSRQEVVGESFYQEAIAGWVARNGRSGFAVFVHEPNNPHSKSGNAMRIDLSSGADRVACGYLPESVAGLWAPVVARAYQEGAWLYCDAEIRGGYDSAPNFGVWLIPQKVASEKLVSLKNGDPGRKNGPRFEPTEESANEFWSSQEPQAISLVESAGPVLADRDSFSQSGAVDLRDLEAKRVRVVGTSFALRDGEQVKAREWMLVREPENPHDLNAIAVKRVSGKRVGYVSAKQAELYAPLLDVIGSKFLVGGEGNFGSTSSRLWVDLPRIPGLRKYVSKVVA
ncbi:HIRAN domain-containing protein [Leucobacter sp. W1153]|uniref:HIRAN domain-containing protein n=1 Tax=Leucobacter sp. W1153 TaxID=3439064 RepID=UPI003F3145B8